METAPTLPHVTFASLLLFLFQFTLLPEQRDSSVHLFTLTLEK